VKFRAIMKSSTVFLAAAIVTMVSLFCPPAAAFDNDELEIFDLVEEVNQNFYEYLELDPDGKASTNEIRKSYRRLSLVLHPDKNDAEDAEVKFRWLASIYDVLRDSKKREIYDRVLVEGLPNWKNPVFYYRRMRKIGLFEGVVYTLILTSLIQYAMHWASYFERKYTLQENLEGQLNKRSTQKKFKSLKKDLDQDKIMTEHMESLGVNKPSVWNLLPFQICKLTWSSLLAAPKMPSLIYEVYQERKAEQEALRRQEKEEEEEAERREQEKKDKKEKQRLRKQLQTEKYQERTYSNNTMTNGVPVEEIKEGTKEKVPRNARQLWTDDQLAKLARLMNKYPGGTQDRWETIAEAMERYPWEITKMAANVKNSMHMAPSQTAGNKVPGLETSDAEEEEDTEDDASETESGEETDSSADGGLGGYTVASKNDYVPVEVKTKTKTRKQAEGDEVSSNGCDWTQVQQKSLEQAIKQFPKGTPDRWDRIAGKVQGKSADDCIQRFKYLAEKVKAKRNEASS